MPRRKSVYPPVFDGFPSYKGGRTVEYNGYVWEFAPGHHLQNIWGFVPQHRWVAEDKVGRPLADGEHVHHLDGTRTNNHPDNLVVLSKSEHHKAHGAQTRERFLAKITEDQVREALATTNGAIKRAAKLLHVDYQTLRNRFPELLKPHQRRSPIRIDNPRDLELILAAAQDPTKSYKDIGAELHVAFDSIRQICRKHGVKWVKKSRAGKQRTKYRGQPTKRLRALDASGSESESNQKPSPAPQAARPCPVHAARGAALLELRRTAHPERLLSACTCRQPS